MICVFFFDILIRSFIFFSSFQGLYLTPVQIRTLLKHRRWLVRRDHVTPQLILSVELFCFHGHQDVAG